MTKLSKAQRHHLEVLRTDGRRCAYPRLKMVVLEGLYRKGLVRKFSNRPGAMFSPTTAILWEASAKGLEVLL